MLTQAEQRKISSDVSVKTTLIMHVNWFGVYQDNLQTIGELKAAIAAKIREIPTEEWVRVMGNFLQWMQVRLKCRDHLKHILKRT